MSDFRLLTQSSFSSFRFVKFVKFFEILVLFFNKYGMNYAPVSKKKYVPMHMISEYQY